MKAVEDYNKFFEYMKTFNFKPKVAALAEVRLDFAEVDEDSGIREAIIDLKQKAMSQMSPTKLSTESS